MNLRALNERSRIAKFGLFFLPLTLALPLTFAVQQDLEHTVLSSQALLEGHFFDFYSFNKSTVGGNDYLIPIYILFAIWIAPLYVLGMRHQSTFNHVIVSNEALSIWAQLLVVIFLGFAIFFLTRLSQHLNPRLPEKPKTGSFLTFSPFAIFAVFFIGQYDIIWIALTFLAIYHGLQGNNLKSSIFFGFAVSIKYFALPIFICFVFIFHKSIKTRILYLFFGLLPWGISVAIFARDSEFMGSIFELPIRLLSVSTPIFAAAIAFFLVAYVVAKRSSLSRSIFRNIEHKQWNVFVLSIALCFSVLFCLVRWNPQWLVIQAALLGLLAITSGVPKWYWVLEGFGFAGLSYLLLTNWSGNLDQSMIGQSFETFLGITQIKYASDILPPGLGSLAITLVQLWIVSPALIAFLNLRSKIVENQSNATLIRLTPILFWIIPVILAFSPSNHGATTKAYADALVSRQQSLGKYHSEASAPNKAARFDFGETTRVSGISIDIWQSGEEVGTQIYFSLKNDNRTTCSGIAQVKQRADDILWSKGWKTAYLLCEKSVEINQLEISASEEFSIWHDTKTEKITDMTNELSKPVYPVMSLLY